MKGMRMMVVAAALWLAVAAVAPGATLAERWRAPGNAAFRAAHLPGARLLVLVSAEGALEMARLLPAAGRLELSQEQRRMMQWFASAAKFAVAHRFEMAMLTAGWKDGKAEKIVRIAIALKFQEPVTETQLRGLLQEAGQQVRKQDGVFRMDGAEGGEALALLEGGRVLVYAETLALLRELEGNMRARRDFPGAQTANLPPQECLLYADLDDAWGLLEDDSLRDGMKELGIGLPSAVALGLDARGAVCRLVCKSAEDAAIYLGALQVAEIVGRQILVAERSENLNTAGEYSALLAGMDRLRLSREGSIVEIRYDGDLLRDCLPVMKPLLEKRGQKEAISDMKQLTLCLFLFADDHDDRLPSAETWKKDLRPYLPPKLLLDGVRYRYYGNGRFFSDDPKPTETVLVVDTVPKDGKFIVGFGDGHVEALEGATIEAALQKRGAIVSPQAR